MSARRHRPKRRMVEALLADPVIGAAVRAHAAAHGSSTDAVWRRVRGYLDEMIPAFNPLVYHGVGHTAARILLGLFYRTRVIECDPGAAARLPADSVVLYVMNHRSNADYVLASYALAGHVAISYAVGEWARVFPLEYLFKSFGSYFIRRRYREPLYHTVLERYVQAITRDGVTQGIFPEGGLTRDGRLRPAKIGLLDYLLGAAADPALAARLHVVPVGLNYDRVLEDRTLLRELRIQQGGAAGSRWTQFGEVASYAVANIGRFSTGRWRRNGEAAVVIGSPIPVAPWLAEVAAAGPPLADRPRPERLAAVQGFCDRLMGEVGALVPVTAVPLVCAALQTFDAEYVPTPALLVRIGELQGALREAGAVLPDPSRAPAEVFDAAYRLLRMRRVLSRAGEGYLILPRGRELVSYYANGIAQRCGTWEAAVRARDALPIDRLLGA